MVEQPIQSIGELLGPYRERLAADLERLLVEPGTPESLAQAVRYCTSGGKRLRPALVYMTAEALGRDDADEIISRAAVAVELVHSYSMVHDDLPALDDDALRRGRATAHAKFGEAMAILVGDALLTRAFGVLAEAGDPAGAARLGGELARWAGPAELIAGQAADMQLCDVPKGREGMEFIHLHKTASLIRGSARMGAICARADPATLEQIDVFGRYLGLEFQIVDDLLDVTGQAHKLGKPTGRDAEMAKRTAVSELGLDGARLLADELADRAAGALDFLGRKARLLVELTYLLAGREH